MKVDETLIERIIGGDLEVEDTSIIWANERLEFSCTRWETSPGSFAMGTNEIAV